jgi:hypothetical protein
MIIKGLIIIKWIIVTAIHSKRKISLDKIKDKMAMISKMINIINKMELDTDSKVL